MTAQVDQAQMPYEVRNWSRFQHFRDRKPPWIKLYRDILDDPDWHNLQPQHAKTLVQLWLLASEYDGMLPDVARIAFRLRISVKDAKQAIEALSGWIIRHDIIAISEGYQSDTPEREGEKETEIDSMCDFDTFWKAYPRKQGKDKARASWNTRRKDMPPIDEILAAVRKQAATDQWHKDGGAFIPLPATWINQGRWQDEGIDPEIKEAPKRSELVNTYHQADSEHTRKMREAF